MTQQTYTYTKLDRGYIRRGPSGSKAHCTGREDASPVHRGYGRGYDALCPFCWLGFSHTQDIHAARVKGVGG